MTNVNREWKSMDDVYKWVQEQGVVEEFLMYEADSNPQFKSKRRKKSKKGERKRKCRYNMKR